MNNYCKYCNQEFTPIRTTVEDGYSLLCISCSNTLHYESILWDSFVHELFNDELDIDAILARIQFIKDMRLDWLNYLK